MERVSRSRSHFAGEFLPIFFGWLPGCRTFLSISADISGGAAAAETGGEDGGISRGGLTVAFLEGSW